MMRRNPVSGLWPLSLEPGGCPASGVRRCSPALRAGGNPKRRLQAPIHPGPGEGNLIRSPALPPATQGAGGVTNRTGFSTASGLRWDGDQVLSRAGRYQLVVVDEAGQRIASISVGEPLLREGGQGSYPFGDNILTAASVPKLARV